MSIVKWQRPLLTTWPGLGRLSDLSFEFDRLFESSGWTPALDVHEDKDNYVVKAELPGMKKEDIEVTLNDGVLSISGERKSETRHESAEIHRAERYFGRFQRTVTLPTTVSADKIQAAYKDGVLTITLPKAEEAKPRKIDVSFN